MSREPKEKPEEKREDQIPKNKNEESDKSPGGKTYGNKPPIGDPKPPKQPDRYEVATKKSCSI